MFLDNTVDNKATDLKALCLDDVYQHIRTASSQWHLKPTTIKGHIAALRSFFAYLFWQGDIPADLRGGLFNLRNTRLATVPKVLSAEQIELLINSCDRHSAKGRRDRAVMLLLVRLGLRAIEVARLTLDDFNWFESVVTVNGKGAPRSSTPTRGCGRCGLRLFAQRPPRMFDSVGIHNYECPVPRVSILIDGTQYFSLRSSTHRTTHPRRHASAAPFIGHRNASQRRPTRRYRTDS